MKSCLILLTLFAGFHAMPSNREDAFPQRIEMRDLESVCVEKYGSLDALNEDWGNHQADCMTWNGSDLLESHFIQFIDIPDEQMFLCACSIYAVEVNSTPNFSVQQKCKILTTSSLNPSQFDV